MSDRAASPVKEAVPADAPVERADDTVVGDVSGETIEVRDAAGVPAPKSKEETSVADAPNADATADEAKSTEETDKPAVTNEDASKAGEEKAAGPGQVDGAAAEPASATASKSNARRKSSAGVLEHKGRLNRKKSKAQMAHTDAKPGDYYMVKLKGYPKWPGIVASEDMLPEALLKSRPVTAARTDGSYREDFAEGGKNILDRTFPIMFLETNEFSWTPNTDLEDLDKSTIADNPKGKMSNALYAAYQLAGENHDLNYFKNLLREFEEARLEEIAAKEAAKAEKVAKTPKKGKKSKEALSEDDDVEMDEGDDGEEKKLKSTKKRKAVAEDTDSVTPKQSAKRPKIKLTTNSKANGTETPKTAKDKKEKGPKAKKANGTPAQPAFVKPQGDQQRVYAMSIRGKIQKYLLNPAQNPRPLNDKEKEEHAAIGDWLPSHFKDLEKLPELVEAKYIKEAKMTKVMRKFLELDPSKIPGESDEKYLDRAKLLLGKFSEMIVAADTAEVAAQANGTKEEVSGAAEKKIEERTAEPAAKVEEPNDVNEAEIPATETEAADVEMSDAKPEVPATETEAADVEMSDTKLEADEQKETPTEEKNVEEISVEDKKTEAAATEVDASA